ncbi:Uncharacterised protein [Chlamydia abortus]|uniref:Uncharacterized protein n=1 Tax=Paenibacillus residui TaxID=629724 RepID=A0ABW3DFI2_9BACL|nr:Uncharacterised protein [Chlamydia abortus]
MSQNSGKSKGKIELDVYRVMEQLSINPGKFAILVNEDKGDTVTGMTDSGESNFNRGTETDQTR